MVDHQRIQLYHLAMVVESSHDCFPGDVRGKWGDGGEGCALVHDGKRTWMIV